MVHGEGAVQEQSEQLDGILRPRGSIVAQNTRDELCEMISKGQVLSATFIHVLYTCKMPKRRRTTRKRKQK